MNLRLPPILIALIVLTVSGSQLGAHEFWLEPDEFSPKLDARTGVRIRIGELREGNHEIRLVSVHADGSTTTKRLHYSRNEGNTDLRKMRRQIDNVIAKPPSP